MLTGWKRQVSLNFDMWLLIAYFTCVNGPKFVLALFAPVLFILCPNKNQHLSHQILLANILSNLSLENIQKAEPGATCYLCLTSDTAFPILNITGLDPYLNLDWNTPRSWSALKETSLLFDYRQTLLFDHVGHDHRKVS